MNLRSLFRYPLFKTKFLTKTPDKRKCIDSILTLRNLSAHGCFRIETSFQNAQTFFQFSPRFLVTSPDIAKCLPANCRQIRQYHQSRIPIISTFSGHYRPYLSASFINTLIKNKYFAYFIRHQLEETFTIEEFKRGAFQAVLNVSRCLAQGELDSLQDLVDQRLLQKLRVLIPDMHRSDQKNLENLEIRKEDILMKFVHHIGVMFDAEDRSKGTRLEIMFGMQSLFGQKSPEFERSKGDHYLDYLRDNTHVYNYRFVREFKSRNESTNWVISDFCHMPVISAVTMEETK